MTTLVAWIAVDQRKPSSAYIASDSRISWEPGTTWDFGQKVFACSRYPELFGFAGDVVLCHATISRLVAAIDGGYLFAADAPAEKRRTAVCQFIRAGLENFPGPGNRAVEIFYLGRVGAEMESQFHFHHLSWRPGKKLTVKSPSLPDRSAIVATAGTGADPVKVWDKKWSETPASGTSRAAFSAFASALQAGADGGSGGPPQLVGLYRIGNGRPFGVVHQGERYWMGARVDAKAPGGDAEWRNTLFERVSWRTTERLPDAAVHLDPGFFQGDS